MSPQLRHAIERDLRYGFNVAAICSDRDVSRAEVLAIRRLIATPPKRRRNQPIKPLGVSPEALAEARLEMIRAGYPRHVIDANFGG